jgi:hypothetical protein
MAKDQYMRKVAFALLCGDLTGVVPVLGEAALVLPVAGGTGADEIAAQATS